MADGDKVRCLGYFADNCVPENYHVWGGLYDGDGDRYVPDTPDGEQYNVVGPGTNYPVGLSLEQAMKWYWKSKNWASSGSVAASQSCVQYGQVSFVEEDPEAINSNVVQTNSTLAPDSGPLTRTFPPSVHLTKMKDIVCSGRSHSFSHNAGFGNPHDDSVGNFYVSGRTSYDVVTYTGDGGGGFSVTMPDDFVKVGDLYYPRISASMSANLSLYGRYVGSTDPIPSPFGGVSSTRNKRYPQNYHSIFSTPGFYVEIPGTPEMQYVSDQDVPSSARLTIDGVDIPLFQPPDYAPWTFSYSEGGSSYQNAFSAGSLTYVANVALTIVDEF